jgi:hypothetical protein
MPELPEVEALRRARRPVRAFPIEHAGPAHVATLKTFRSAACRTQQAGALSGRASGKRLLFPPRMASSSAHPT